MNKQEHSRQFADKNTEAGREFIERGIWGAEEATNGVKQSFSSSLASMRELNIALIEVAHANADAIFDLAHKIASAHAPSDLGAIWSAHARRHFEMMAKQGLALTELGQKLASRTTHPLTHSVNQVFR